MQLSVVIITLNEERNISRCLEAVSSIADEIIVVDSGSIDNTKMICKQFNVKFLEHSFQSYGLQKDFATRMAKYDHILSLDADEVLDDELANSIRITKLNWKHDCYVFKRITNYCGQWIFYGEWYPDKIVRLFDRRKARWRGNIHEKILADDHQNTGFLKGTLLHYSYHSIDQFRERTIRYASMEAMELFDKNIYPGFFHLYLKPFYRFLRSYILLKGFMDGNAGFQIARMTAIRLYLRFEKLKQLHAQKRNSPAGI